MKVFNECDKFVFPRLLCVAALLAVFPALGYGQSTQHLVWTPVPGSVNYEVLIEQLQDGNTVAYREFARERTRSPSFDVSLPNGSYRFRVFGYNDRNELVGRSEWTVFRAGPLAMAQIPPPEPEPEPVPESVAETPPPQPEKPAQAVQPAPEAPQQYYEGPAVNPGYLSMGLGGEVNLNTINKVGYGVSLRIEYRLNDYLSSGLRFRGSYDFDQLAVYDGEIFVRWYLTGAGIADVFLDGAAGASLLHAPHSTADQTVEPTVLFSLSAGIRFNIGNWYIEPFARGGVPFIGGAGLVFGHHFRK
jgi:hypothetical protein